MSHPATPPVDPSLAEVWHLKDIKFHGKDLRIITQNFNGCVKGKVSHVVAALSCPPPDHAHLSQYVRQRLPALSILTLCPGNILILRGNIEIQPPSRQNVSYEFLSQLVADYLLRTSPDVDVSAALSIMPKTQSTLFQILELRVTS